MDEADHVQIDSAELRLLIDVGHGITGTLGMPVWVSLRPEWVGLSRSAPAGDPQPRPGHGAHVSPIRRVFRFITSSSPAAKSSRPACPPAGAISRRRPGRKRPSELGRQRRRGAPPPTCPPPPSAAWLPAGRHLVIAAPYGWLPPFFVAVLVCAANQLFRGGDRQPAYRPLLSQAEDVLTSR